MIVECTIQPQTTDDALRASRKYGYVYLAWILLQLTTPAIQWNLNYPDPFGHDKLWPDLGKPSAWDRMRNCFTGIFIAYGHIIAKVITAMAR